jgi:hypothetical protein
MDDFERAKDKIIMGAERRSMVMPEEERRNTAYHESGHAVVARLLPKTDPVHKVTIIPRGRALGVTMQLPTEDRYSMDRERLLQNISVLFGGRIAEELFMSQMTTGASNDFQRATDAWSPNGACPMQWGRWCMPRKKAKCFWVAPSPSIVRCRKKPCARSMPRCVTSSISNMVWRGACSKKTATRWKP